MAEAIELTTERLLLRQWRDEDVEPFVAMNADPEVMAYFPGTLPRAESELFLARIHQAWERDGFGLWAVERRADGAWLGMTGLAAPSFEAAFTPCVEVGWRFPVSSWGHGYATEAARAAVAFGFETLGLDEILSWTTVANQRSRAVMERIGMTHDPADDFDHPRLPVGHPVRPHVLYRLGRPA